MASLIKASGDFVFQVLVEVRPYALIVCKDLAVGTLFWIAIYLFKTVTEVLKIEGWANDFIPNIHSASIICAFVLIAGLLLVDIVNIHRDDQ